MLLALLAEHHHDLASAAAALHAWCEQEIKP